MAADTEQTAQVPAKHFSWKQKCLAMVVALVLALAATEVALRLLPQFSYLNEGGPPMYQPDEDRGWRLKPNLSATWYDRRFERGQILICTDELGNRKTAPPDKSNRLPEYRILLVGDSFTFGWGVEADETFGKILQDRLNAAFPDLRIRVVNGGVPAYGPENELETVKQLTSAIKPNLVVLGFTENDFENVASGRDYQIVKDGWLRSPQEAAHDDEYFLWCKRYAYHHSALVRLAYHTYNRYRSPSARQRGVFLGYTLEILRKEPRPEVSAAIQRTTAILAQIKDCCAAQNAAFQVVSFPRSYQIFEDEFLQRLKETGVPRDDFSPEVLSERIHSICDQLAVSHISVKAPFEAARDAGIERDTLFIHNDGHWTVRGHELVAGAMLPGIERAIGMPLPK